MELQKINDFQVQYVISYTLYDVFGYGICHYNIHTKYKCVVISTRNNIIVSNTYKF